MEKSYKQKKKIYIVILCTLLFILSSLLIFTAVIYINEKNIEAATTFSPTEELSASIATDFFWKNMMPIPTASPSPTPEPTPTAVPVYTAKIAAVGDLMVHQWQLDDGLKRGGGPNGYSFFHTFEEVKKYLTDADLTIGNLETTFSGVDLKFSDYPAFNTPDEFADAIKDAGFDIVSTANNHSNDRREAGVLRTIDVLDKIGLLHMGSYQSEEAGEEILLKEINHIKFAFLSYTYGTNGIPITAGKPYLINLLDEEKIKEDIKRAKELAPDFIVVMPHMGEEYEQYPRAVHKNLINMMITAGADIVLASHPHVLQPMEFIEATDEDGNKRECFVIYSLGNFISSQRTIPRDEGVILNLYFEKTGEDKAVIKNVSYIPTWVKFNNRRGAYDIKVLSVYDTLKEAEHNPDIDVRPKDLARLKKVHEEVSQTLVGEVVPLDEIRNEYYMIH